MIYKARENYLSDYSNVHVDSYTLSMKETFSYSYDTNDSHMSMHRNQKLELSLTSEWAYNI